MLTKMNHPNGEVYVDLWEIIHMERENRPNTTLLLPNERDYFTLITLRSGKLVSVTNTPEEVLAMVKASEYQTSTLPEENI